MMLDLSKAMFESLVDMSIKTYQNPIQIKTLIRLLREVIATPGCVAELGVCFGGTLQIIAERLPGKEIYGFDTFDGLPEMGNNDAPQFWEEWRKDNLRANYNEVLQKFEAFPNVKLIKGYFPATADLIQNEAFCFVHVDGDLYQSTKDAIEFFMPRMVSGGIILFDDYRYKRCPGVTTAIQEYVTQHRDFIHKPVGSYQYLFRKVKPMVLL